MRQVWRKTGAAIHGSAGKQALGGAALTACLAAGLFAPNLARASINLYIDGAGTGNWDDGNNWVSGAVPGNDDDVYIDSGFTVTSTGTEVFGGELQVGLEANAYGRGNPGGPATLNINAGSITMGNKSLVIGQSQYSTDHDNSGVINIAAGATLSSQGYVLIGFFGPLGTPTTGTLNVNGGTFNNTGGGEFRIGARDGNYNSGFLNITNGGTVNTTKGVFLGGASNATMTIAGAGSSFTTTQFISMGTEGANGSSVANLIISGGTVSCRELSVNEGKSGTNTLTQTGGALNLDQTTSGTPDLQIGRSTNGDSALGIYDMSGGTLSVPNGQIKIASGNNGILNVSGTAAVTVGATKSIQLNPNERPNASAVVNQSGGSVTLAADSAQGVSFSGVGTTTYNLNGGTLTTPLLTATAGAGTRSFNFNGGTLVANGNITATTDLNTTIGTSGATIDTNGNTVTWNAPLSGAGGLTKAGAGTLSVTASSYSGTTTVKAGTLSLANSAQTPVLTGAGGADVQGGKLVLDYTGGSSPVAQVQTVLSSGYASHFASGQIRGTTLSASQTLGYGDDGTSKVTVMVTLPGDANLDGAVNFNDFLLLQAAFGNTGTRFDQGNFNYDNVTNFNDFLLLQANFGQSVSGAAVPVTAAERAAVASFAQTVPEPASAAILSLASGMMLMKRRTRRAG